jgi:hypothetical protein
VSLAQIQISTRIAANSSDVYSHISDLQFLPRWLAFHLQVKFSEQDGIDVPATPPPILREGLEFIVRLERFGLEIPTRIRIDEMKPNEKVSYRTIQGLFASFVHRQTIVPHVDASILLDEVEFEVGFGIFGALAADLYIRNEIEEVLKFRQARIEEHFRL